MHCAAIFDKSVCKTGFWFDIYRGKYEDFFVTNFPRRALIQQRIMLL